MLLVLCGVGFCILVYFDFEHKNIPIKILFKNNYENYIYSLTIYMGYIFLCMTAFFKSFYKSFINCFTYNENIQIILDEY